MTLSKDEITLLRQARELDDMMHTPGWKTLREILLARAEAHQQMLVMAGTGLPNSAGWDGVTRYGAGEYIKGAYMGLRLALDTPATILMEAKRLREESSPSEGEE